MAAVLAVCGFVAAAHAAPYDDKNGSVLVYNAEFFADARPNTAYDMLARLPAFTFDDGKSARGFAGTAGNVLIDGQRPTAKTDDLQSILQRIPASSVSEIDLIRGGAPGIDMHGQTVVANVITKKADSTQVVVQASDQLWLNDHHTMPQGSVEYNRRSGDTTLEASIATVANYDDSVGKGLHQLTDVLNGTVTKQQARTNGTGTGGSFTGAIATPLFDGQFKANIALSASPFHSTNFYTTPGFLETVSDMNAQNSAELGLHWTGPVGPVSLETLFLQRLGHQTDLNISDAPLDLERFHSTANTGESIGRATLRYAPLDTLTLEAGGEAAYNFLDGTSSFFDNGVSIPVPSGTARVNEKREEVFGQGTWNISDQWLLEAGARFEFSTISETGAVNLSRSFFYPKPRAVLTWNPDKDTQLRARYEVVLGQLDFNNFIASSNLAGIGVTAGNANLKPDQHTQYELSYERHFLGKGSIVATLMHEDIKDVVDYVPIDSPTGIFDAPGNIGNGSNNEIIVALTLPLDWLGLKNGLLQSTNTFNLTSVPDPVTGDGRVISGQRPQEIKLTLTQDIDSLKSTWGIFYYNAWNEHYFRLTQIRSRRVLPPYFELWWDYKPRNDLSLRFEVFNPFRFVYDDRFENFAGPRDVAPLSNIEEIRIRSQPRVYFQIRKTFG